METRRSTRLSLKGNAKSSQAFKTNKKNSLAERDGSASPVPSKKTKSSYFDPDFSEKSDSAHSSPSEESDSAPDSPPQKRKPKKKVNSKAPRKSKNYSDSESSSNEFITKPIPITKILESKTELKLSSDESDSSEESPPKRVKKADGTPVKKKPPTNRKKSDGESSSEEFVDKSSSKLNESKLCKSEPLDDEKANDEEKTSSQAEYFDFTALVNKVTKADATEVENEPKIEPKSEPEKEPSKTKQTKRARKTAPKPETKPEEKADLEVFELLAMGEDTDMSAKDIKESVSQNSKQDYEIPKQVEVLLDAPILKKKKTTDLEMTLRRRLNFIRRENQVYVHKVHILCLIAHGMHVNSILNSADLLSLALSLLPSDKCYPPKRMDMNYLGQLIEWFVKKIKLKKEPVDDKKTPLSVSLQTQFQNKEADNKNNLCFMFICIIRALGIKCRLIINLNVVPLKPSSDQLLPINTTKDPSKPSSSKKMLEKESSSKSKTESKKSKASEKSEKIETPKQSSRSSEKSKNKDTPTKKSSSNENITPPKKSSSRSGCDENKEKQTPSKDRSSRSRSEKSETSSQSSRSRSEKIDEKVTPSDSKRSSRHTIKSQEKTAEPTRRSGRTKSTDSKQKSEYFDEEKTTRRSERVTNSKSGYFENETLEESKSSKSKNSSKQSTSKSKKDNKKNDTKSGENYEPENLVEEMSTSDDSDDDTDDNFVPAKKTKSKKKIDRRVLSSEEDVNAKEKEDSKNKQNKSNYWIEVFLEAEEQWICVDVAKKSYHCIQQLYNATTHPVRYIVAFNNDQTIKDVTRRYVPQYLSVTRKLRVDDVWWKSTLDPFKPPQNAQNREEDEALDRVLEEQPLPTSISEYKNHPLYALKRHLLKFQAIYPPDAPPLGFVKGEAVYSRLCVHQLHGREMWIKEAKVVKMGEKPYKIVKGRQKKDKFGTDEGPKDLELFGIWQTEDYDPPVAENGIVPRNSFGNVELFKMCMLPKGTVYLQIPGLQRIANKLNIDCAAAITGFEYSTNGWSYPVKDGFVVCEEYKDILLDAYNQEVEEAERKEKQKREERVYANWRRLIKGLFIREKLKRKYNFGDPGTSSEKDEKTKSDDKH